MRPVGVASHHMKIGSGPGILKVMKRFYRPALLAASTLLLAACGTMRSSVSVEPASGGRRPVSAERYRAPIKTGSYVVVKGDTLYSIAFRGGVDFRDLARWNRIQPPYTIWPGQRLRLSAPASTASSPVGMAASPAFKPITKTAPQTLPTRVPSVAAAPSVVVPAAGHAATSATARTSSAATGPSRSISGVTWRWPADGRTLKGFKSSDAIPGIEIAGKSGDPVRAAADGVVVYSGNGLVGYGELVIIKHNDSFLSAYGHNRKRLVKEGQRVRAGEEIAEMGSTGASRTELEFQIRKNGNPVDPLDYLPSR